MAVMSYETLFWIAAVLMTLAAALAVVRAFWGKNKEDAPGLARDLAREALSEQLTVLADEKAAGLVNDRIYEASVADVERRALEEIREDEKRTAAASPMGRAFAVLVVALVAIASFAIYGFLGSPSLINFVSGTPKAGIMQADGTLGSTEGLYDEASLAAYLTDNTEDERAWVLYARLLARRHAWSEAAEAYGKAVAVNKFVAKDPDVLSEYAASLVSQKRTQAYEKSVPILQKALSFNSKHGPSRELYVIVSLELGHWKEARESIEMLLAQISMDDPVYERLAQTAAYAAAREREEAAAQKQK